MKGGCKYDWKGRCEGKGGSQHGNGASASCLDTAESILLVP